MSAIFFADIFLIGWHLFLLPYCFTAREQSRAEELESRLYSLPILYWCQSNHGGQSTNPLTLCFALSNGFMSALKSRSHLEAPARLAVSFILLLIDCLCVSNGFPASAFSTYVMWHLYDSQLTSHSWLIFRFFLSFCLQGPIIPLPSFFSTLPLFLVYPIGNLAITGLVGFILTPRNKAEGEIIPEA